MFRSFSNLFRHFTYVTAHSSTLPSLYLRHSSFPNPSVASPPSHSAHSPTFFVTSPTLQLILQPFRRFFLHHSSLSNIFRHFTYVTTHSLTLPSLYIRHSSFSNPSVASPTSQFISNPSFASSTSQALHLRHLASRPCL